MPQDSVDFYIWSSDQSYIYYMYNEDLDPPGIPYYFIRGKPLPSGTNSSLLPGEISIKSGTNNVWWRDTDTGTLYQAKGINLSQEEPEKINNEIYTETDSFYSTEKLNLIRSQQKFLLSSSRVRNTTDLGTYDKQTNVLFIIDSSGSMRTRLEGNFSRLEASVSILKDLFNGLPDLENIRVGLGFLGGKSGSNGRAACSNFPILTPIDNNNKESLISSLNQLRAAGGTPIAAALNNAVSVFDDLEKENSADNYVVLLSDGKEECGGDVKEAAKNVFESGINLRVIGLGMGREYRNDFGFDEGYVEFFENPSEAAGLGAAISRSLAVTKKEMKLFQDEKENVVISEEEIIRARQNSKTKRQYVDAYVRLEGVPNDFYRIKIPDLRSGYTYNVSYDYVPSVAGNYFCGLSQQKIGPINNVFEIPEEKTCANSFGADGVVCKIEKKTFYWKQGNKTKSGNASCNKEADLGRSSRFFGVRSSSNCGNYRYKNPYFRCRSLNDIGKKTCEFDYEFAECKAKGKWDFVDNKVYFDKKRGGISGIIFGSPPTFSEKFPSAKTSPIYARNFEIGPFNWFLLRSNTISVEQALGRQFPSNISCNYAYHYDKTTRTPKYFKGEIDISECYKSEDLPSGYVSSKYYTERKTEDTVFCGCYKKKAFKRSETKLVYYDAEQAEEKQLYQCRELVSGEIREYKYFGCSVRETVPSKTIYIDCDDTRYDNEDEWTVTTLYYDLKNTGSKVYFAYYCKLEEYYWDNLGFYENRRLNKKYGHPPPFGLGFRGCLSMANVGDHKVVKTNETLRTCVDEGIYECVGDFDVRYCEGSGGAPSEWNNLTVTDDDGDEIQYVTYETTN